MHIVNESKDKDIHTPSIAIFKDASCDAPTLSSLGSRESILEVVPKSKKSNPIRYYKTHSNGTNPICESFCGPKFFKASSFAEVVDSSDDDICRACPENESESESDTSRPFEASNLTGDEGASEIHLPGFARG